jgi:MFS family permease
VSRAPEFLLMFITTIYVALFVILYVTEPRGVPLLRLYLDNWQYPYYICGVFCLLLIATFFALIGTYRLFIRKKRVIEPKIHFYIKNRKFDMYWIFITASFILCAAVGLIAYWITKILSYFLIIIFVSIFIILYLNAFLHYVMNDYAVLQDIDMFNLKI